MATKKRATTGTVDWVGGIVSLPTAVIGEGAPFQPELLLWLTSDGLIVGLDTGRAGELLGRVVRHFRQTTRQPMIGPEHVPSRVRVASEAMAEALRAGLGDEVAVVHAPTPELDAIVLAMSATLELATGEEATTFLAPGIDAGAMGAFFRAAAGLFAATPWKSVPDDESLLLVTCPALGLHEAVVLFLGHHGEPFGIVLFADIATYEAFVLSAYAVEEGEEVVLPPHFAVNFERAEDLSPALVREVAERGWIVANADAYPCPITVLGDVLARPPTLEELKVAEVLALALPEVLTEDEAVQRAWAGRGDFSRTVTVAAHAGTFEVTLRARSAGDLVIAA